MALIKCSECGKDVSDKAPTCPNCGNPIHLPSPAVVHLANAPGQNLHIEPELTNKTWKKVKIVAGCIMFSSIIVGPALGGSDSNTVLGATFGIFFLGAIAMVIASIGAWYADKRTR